MEKTSSTNSTSTQQVNETSNTKTTSNNSKQNSTISSAKSSTTKSSSVNASNSNSQMVWVGETGTKYHNQWCGTLKGKGHQITMEQAQAEGRQPCKVCH